MLPLDVAAAVYYAFSPPFFLSLRAIAATLSQNGQQAIDIAVEIYFSYVIRAKCVQCY